MIGRDFDMCRDTVERELMRHPVVIDNAYTAWFAEGRVPSTTSATSPCSSPCSPTSSCSPPSTA